MMDYCRVDIHVHRSKSDFLKSVDMNVHPTGIRRIAGTATPAIHCLDKPQTGGHKCPPYET